MDNPEKLAALGTQDKRLKQTNKNKTQHVLDTISKESSINILSRPIVCYYFPHIIVVALACLLKPRASLALVVLVVDMQLSMQSLYITNKVVG